MKVLDGIFTEEHVSVVAGKILAATIGKITDDLSNKFYYEIADFLDEHYRNAKDNIHAELVKEITEEFVKDSKDYRFAILREKIFKENKEELVKALTDEAIEKSVENVIHNYTHRSYQFDWQWKEAIVRIVLERWDTLKDDDRIKNSFGRKIENLKGQINDLQIRLNSFTSQCTPN